MYPLFILWHCDEVGDTRPADSELTMGYRAVASYQLPCESISWSRLHTFRPNRIYLDVYLFVPEPLGFCCSASPFSINGMAVLFAASVADSAVMIARLLRLFCSATNAHAHTHELLPTREKFNHNSRDRVLTLLALLAAYAQLKKKKRQWIPKISLFK